MSLAAIVAADLPAPVQEPPRVHDASFAHLCEVYDGARQAVSEGIDLLRGLGLGLPSLPEAGLEELVVLPVSGDGAALRANAEAARHLESGLHVHAAQLAALGAQVALRWRGLAGPGCVVRLEQHALAVEGLALTLTPLAVGLDELARFCDRVAEEVERLVVELVRIVRRLVLRLLARLSGPGGWAAVAAEFAIRGIEVVADIVDDVERVIALLQRCEQIKDDVVAAAHDHRRRIEEVGDLVASVGRRLR
ncbi:hypothetical protein [Nocardioides sp.]|uniref:hypothetical protein n=1 Tax=Nocardioides sp. TaxID=35761 RepID=UPI003518556D